MPSESIHIGAHSHDCIKSGQLSIVCAWYNVISSSVRGHFRHSHTFVVVGSVAMNIRANTLLDPDFYLFFFKLECKGIAFIMIFCIYVPPDFILTCLPHSSLLYSSPLPTSIP